MPYQFDPGPSQSVLTYFRQKGWKIGFDFRDVWLQEHSAAWTVAKAAEIDVLAAIRFAMDRALEDGQTFASFKASLTPVLQRLGWWGKQVRTDPLTGVTGPVQLGSPARLRTIYRTNLRTARAAGQSERVKRTLDTHPYLRYSLGPSRVHRPIHVGWNGLVLPATDGFWDSHYPPNGWGCLCRVRSINRREGDRLGVSDSPVIEMRAVVNKRTGRTEFVPVGVDPAFNFHPGDGRQDVLSRTLSQKRDRLARTLRTDLPDIPKPLELTP